MTDTQLLANTIKNLTGELVQLNNLYKRIKATGNPPTGIRIQTDGITFRRRYFYCYRY